MVTVLVELEAALFYLYFQKNKHRQVQILPPQISPKRQLLSLCFTIGLAFGAPRYNKYTTELVVSGLHFPNLWGAPIKSQSNKLHTLAIQAQFSVFINSQGMKKKAFEAILLQYWKYYLLPSHTIEGHTTYILGRRRRKKIYDLACRRPIARQNQLLSLLLSKISFLS